MKHRGYTARPVFDEEDRVFHGRVDDIADVVTFEGATVDELEAAFRHAVYTYIAFAEERGMQPERPCSGKFVVRIPPELHRRVRAAADAQGTSLNTWVQATIEQRLRGGSEKGTGAAVRRQRRSGGGGTRAVALAGRRWRAEPPRDG